MGLGFLLGQRRYRRIQPAADGFGDGAHLNAFFRHRVILRPRLAGLQHEAKKAGDIQNVRRRPAVKPFADIGGHPRLARHGDHPGDQPLFHRVVDLGKTHHRGAHALRHESESRLL